VYPATLGNFPHVHLWDVHVDTRIDRSLLEKKEIFESSVLDVYCV